MLLYFCLLWCLVGCLLVLFVCCYFDVLAGLVDFVWDLGFAVWALTFDTVLGFIGVSIVDWFWVVCGYIYYLGWVDHCLMVHIYDWFLLCVLCFSLFWVYCCLDVLI